MGEESAVLPGESEALGDGVPPSGCGAGGGPVACESGFPDAAAGSEPHLSVPSEGQVELAWLCRWSRLCGRGAAA